MDIIYIFNGLGNQMSQYALYLHKKSLGQNVQCFFRDTAHNGIELNKLFGIDTQNSKFSFIYSYIFYFFVYSKHQKMMSVIKRFLGCLRIKGIVERDGYNFNPEVLEPHKGLNIFFGGWHNYRYLEPIELLVRKSYQFPSFKDEKNIGIKDVACQPQNVAVHIRRGDYLIDDKLGPVCDKRYFMKCVEYFEQIIDSPVFYIFSNDPEWSKLIFEGKKHIIVDWNKGVNSWVDMALMSSFKNIIISNSTFSFWSAWLGNCENVLCPPFFLNNDYSTDIFPPSWVRISAND